MLQHHLIPDRLKAFLMMALLVDRSQVSQVVPFLPLQDQPLAAQTLEMLLKKTKEEKREIVLDELKRLSVEFQRSSLNDIHPDWILEALSKESPRMIATVLRYLPGEHVRYLLEKFPDEKLKAMPVLSETFSINPELVQVLKKMFEAQFSFPKGVNNPPQNISFDSLCFLPALKLKLLFHEIGMREMAMAFTTLNSKTVDLILSRLQGREAALLKDKMRQEESVTEERLKQAQSHLVFVKPEKRDSESLILGVGFIVYSKALLPQHLDGARLILKKFPFDLGMILERAIDKNKGVNSEKLALRYQKEIMQALRNLEAP